MAASWSQSAGSAAARPQPRPRNLNSRRAARKLASRYWWEPRLRFWRRPGMTQSKQQNVVAASKRVVSELGIPAVKHAMDINGYYGGPPRLPLLPLTAAQKAEVEAVMTSCRN